MERAKKLRQMLNQNDFWILPGIYDCLGARIVENAGANMLFLSGGALSYSKLGQPDIGLLTLRDFSETILNITRVTQVPLIADADNGFGNAIHAANTAFTYEQSGASGLQIDDKVLPSTNPKQDEVIAWNLIAPKIKAMRQNVTPEFVIVFRTCAHLYGLGLDEAIDRVNKAAECGADIAYIDGLKSIDEIKRVSDEAKIKLMINLNEKGFAGGLSQEEIRQFNFKVGLYPISTMLAAAKGITDVMQVLESDGSTLRARDNMVDPPSIIYNMMGLTSLAERYQPLYED